MGYGTMFASFSRKEFLETLFGNYYDRHTGFIMVRCSNRTDYKISTRYFPNIDRLAREPYPEDQNVYFSVCPREKMKPDREHIKVLTCLWAGLDIGPDGFSGKMKHFANDKQAEIAIKSFPLPPSIVVNSGRGKHLYWILKEAIPLNDTINADIVLNKINAYFQCASGTKIDTLLRLPGTTNYRHQSQYSNCSVECMDPGVRYELKDFTDLDLRIIIPSKKAPKIDFAPPVLQKKRIVVIDEKSSQDILGNIRPSTNVHEMSEFTNYRQDIASIPPSSSRESNVDHLMQQLLDRFSDEILDQLADRVVKKLLVAMRRNTDTL